MTVTFIASSRLLSITMPEMMLASSSTASAMIWAASATSWRVRSAPPEMLISTPLAPWIEVSSSSGDEIARWAASMARFSPLATPVPISAMPMPVMIVLTSAKSTLISPGTVIRSLMPCTAWRSTSSAIRNASESGRAPLHEVEQPLVRDRDQGVDRGAQLLDRLVGDRHAPRGPRSRTAWSTTATVSAPISEASDARIGAEPLPVPPPRPAVMNTMSAPSSDSRIASVSSSADLRPDLRVGAGPEPAGQRPAELELERRPALAERLDVGVDRHELDAA